MTDKSSKSPQLVAVDTATLQTYVLPEQGVAVEATSTVDAAEKAKKLSKEQK